MLVVWGDFFAASMLAGPLVPMSGPQHQHDSKTDERDDDRDGIRLSGFMGVLLCLDYQTQD